MTDVDLPRLHAGQVRIWQNRKRLNAVRCGRRFGKTLMMITMAADAAVKGKKVGLFTPEHRQWQEPYDQLLEILHPVRMRSSKTEGAIRTTTRGAIDFWYLNDNELAGRGREYDLVLLDEAAFTKDGQMQSIWDKSINPTMLTRPKAQAWVFSTPRGNSPENFFWKICNDKSLGFAEHYAPTSANPYILPDELDRERANNHPLVFQQEFLAEFVDWSGPTFFQQDKLLLDGMPVDYPPTCDYVFATIDTAVKDRSEHDGTAVIYWARDRIRPYGLVILDWDIIQIEGSLLETWLPIVFERMQELANACGARFGASAAHIEDKGSGTILLQQSARRSWPAEPIDTKLVSLGKDARAINVSGYVHRGLVKISRYAFEKVATYKGVTRNHLLSQIIGFRIGAKEGAADDLVDCFTYGIAGALGNSEGF